MGDELLSVNGTSLEQISHKDALLVIKNAGDKLLFKILRKKDSKIVPIPSPKPSEFNSDTIS